MTEKDFDVQGFARDINELLVLSALRTGPKHGYQIGLDVETDSNGLFRFRWKYACWHIRIRFRIRRRF